jgi:phage terminase large subunit-like protein
MVREVLSLAAPDLAVRLVRASKGKRARAEPIAALYEQGRVVHLGAFPALEDEMCSFGAPGFDQSPDRLDALVWALSDLMLGRRSPRARLL